MGWNGRHLRLPVDLAFGKPPEGQSVNSEDEYVQNIVDDMRYIHDMARISIGREIETYKDCHDRNLNFTKYVVGQLVLVYNKRAKFQRSRKMVSPYEGPYKIVDKLSDVTFVLERGKKRVVRHHNLLKKYYTNDELPSIPESGLYETVDNELDYEDDDNNDE